MSHKAEIAIKEVIIIRRCGMDTIHLVLDSPVPEIGYDATARIEVRDGYGPEFCLKNFGIEAKLIIA